MTVELSHEDYPAIAALTAAIAAFLDMGAAPVLLPVFLLVARYPERTCAELARLEGTPLATMGRYLLTLGHINLGLVKTVTEVGDSRYIRHSLTEKGVALANRIAGMVRS
jgi:hypothetical protein